MNPIKNLGLALLCLAGLASADLKKVDFINTKVRGRKIVVPELSNAQAGKFFDSDFLKGRASALCYVRFNDKSEGLFAAGENSGQIRFIHTSRQIRTYFPQGGSQPKLSYASDITVHPDGMGYVVDQNLSTIHRFKVLQDLQASYLASKKFEAPYRFVRQSMSPAGERFVFALSHDGALGIFDENLLLVRGVDLHLFAGQGFKSLEVGAFDPIKNAFPILALKEQEKGWVDVEYAPAANSASIEETSMKYASDDVIVDIGLNYHDESEFNVFALGGTGNILEFSRSGVLIGRPIVSWDQGLLAERPLTWPNLITGCSGLKYDAACQSLMVSEDLGAGGGFKKFDVVGNAGAYYHPLKVEIRDLSPTEPNISKPAIRITNLSATKVLFGYKVRYWVSKQEFPSQLVLADKYYANPDGVTLGTGCLPANLNVCYVEIAYPESVELESGQTTNPDWLQFGAHFDQYYPGQWDKSNDWSMAGVSADWKETRNLTIYDLDGNLVYGTPPDPGAVPQPPSTTAAEVFSFESYLDWSLGAGSLQPIASPCTHGAKCLQFDGAGYRILASRPFPFTLPAGTADKLSVDFQIVDYAPEAQYWLGTMQLFVGSRHAGIYNAYVGQVDLSSGSQRTFFGYKWQLPADLLAKLRAGFPDLVLTFAINTPAGAGPFRIDNIRFSP